ncbi:MAG TPA: ATP-dependent DNA ligase, partial [Propionibacteriaceae bacterium]|nr:ATP-dependent DNA ligase [Propionibacteriaceae bacterium]
MSGGSRLPDDVSFTHLDQELFDGAGATKRDLIDYLDAVHACMLPNLTDRPLSVIRVRPG